MGRPKKSKVPEQKPAEQPKQLSVEDRIRFTNRKPTQTQGGLTRRAVVQ